MPSRRPTKSDKPGWEIGRRHSLNLCPRNRFRYNNIYPGFDEKDRLLMIRNYLDGVHLKTMALNGPDGTIYVYTATEEDWQVRRGEPNYFDKLDVEAKAIAARGALFTREAMPRTNYSVILSPVPLTSFQRRYLWSDEVRITDNNTDEVIAYNRRLMRRWYMIAPDFAFGNRYYSPRAICGENYIYGYDENLFIFYKTVPWQPAHIGVNRDLFKKFKKLEGDENAK